MKLILKRNNKIDLIETAKVYSLYYGEQWLYQFADWFDETAYGIKR